MNKEETEQIAKDLFDSTVKPYFDRWELLDGECKELHQQWKDTLKDVQKARLEFRDVQKEARKRYYKSIGEERYANQI